MSPYAPPQYARDPARQQLMEFNEVPLVPPESVAERLMEFARSDQLNLYPQYGPLLNKLSDYTGAAPESLLLTNGSDQGIELILRAFLDPGDHCVLTKPGFAMFQQVANAIGAAIASVSGQVDRVYKLGENSREEALRQASEAARMEAVAAGADPGTTEIVELEEVPMAYLTEPVVRIRAKAAGNLGIQ